MQQPELQPEAQPEPADAPASSDTDMTTGQGAAGDGRIDTL